MPQLDRTGPAGAGPRTGRGMGSCGTGQRGTGMPYGRCGRGFGPGRFGGWYPSQPKLTKKEETEILNEEAGMLQEDLEIIKKRISELKGQK